MGGYFFLLLFWAVMGVADGGDVSHRGTQSSLRSTARPVGEARKLVTQDGWTLIPESEARSNEMLWHLQLCNDLVQAIYSIELRIKKLESLRVRTLDEEWDLEFRRKQLVQRKEEYQQNYDRLIYLEEFLKQRGAPNFFVSFASAGKAKVAVKPVSVSSVVSVEKSDPE